MHIPDGSTFGGLASGDWSASGGPPGGRNPSGRTPGGRSPDELPEWLRPLSERYLAGDAGPAPATVRVASTLAGINAGFAVGVLAIAIGDTGDLFTGVTLGLLGAALLVVFTLAVPLGPRRGWTRLPGLAGIVLGVLALYGLWVASTPVIRVGERLVSDWSNTAVVAPWLVAAASTGFGLALVLRTRSASDWLAKRRHQVRTGTLRRSR